MQLKLLYLARLRETLGRSGEALDVPDGGNVASLLALLRERGGTWSSELAAGRAVRIAVNQEMSTPAAGLHDGDEVALFPPVTGG